MPILVSFARVGLVSALVAVGVFAGLTASATLTSGDSPGLQIQGDVNCDTHVDSADILVELDYLAQVTPPAHHQPCTAVGAAIPAVVGPQGPQGPQGAKGDRGPAGVNLFANVDGTLGTLKNGTALSAESTVTGVYLVRFGQDVSNCAAVANSGTVGGTGTFSEIASIDTHVGGGFYPPEDVEVDIYNTQGGSLVNSDFHLIVVC
jgi:hypothetical protein